MQKRKYPPIITKFSLEYETMSGKFDLTNNINDIHCQYVNMCSKHMEPLSGY